MKSLRFEFFKSQKHLIRNTLLVTTLLTPSLFILIDSALKGRPLTEGEIKMSQSVFKDSIDYSKVYIHDRGYFPFQADGEAMAPNGKIYFSGEYLDDFSKTKNQGHKDKFIHEMTHVWQYQNNILNPIIAAITETLKYNFNYAKAYRYDLSKHDDLIKYGAEQQANIMQYSFRLRSYASIATIDHKKKYDKVLTKFNKDPNYARQSNFLIRSINSLKK